MQIQDELFQTSIDRLGGRGWTERKRRKPRGFGLRPPAPATRHSKFDKALASRFFSRFGGQGLIDFDSQFDDLAIVGFEDGETQLAPSEFFSRLGNAAQV